MTEPRNDYGFPFADITEWPEFLAALAAAHPGASLIGYCSRPRHMSKLERAQAYAADVRARRGMVVRKGVYLDLIK